MVLHRDFLSPEKSEDLGFPSLAICVNASRSLAHVLYVAVQRNVIANLLPWCIFQVTSASMLLLIKHVSMFLLKDAFCPVLILTAYSVYASGKIVELSEASLGDVQKCLEVLIALQTKCTSSKLIHDAVYRLSHLREMRHSNERQSNPQYGEDYIKNSNPVLDPMAQTFGDASLPPGTWEAPVTSNKRQRLGSQDGLVAMPDPMGYGSLLPPALLDLPIHTSELGIPTFQNQHNFFNNSMSTETPQALLSPNVPRLDNMSLVDGNGLASLARDSMQPLAGALPPQDATLPGMNPPGPLGSQPPQYDYSQMTSTDGVPPFGAYNLEESVVSVALDGQNGAPWSELSCLCCVAFHDH